MKLKEYNLNLIKLIKGERASHTLMILITALWVIFIADLLLQTVGLTIRGLGNFDTQSVFMVFIIITLFLFIPVVILTFMQLQTLNNGIEVNGKISNIRQDRSWLILTYEYSVNNESYTKSKIVKVKDGANIDKNSEELIIVNRNKNSRAVFTVI